MGINTSVPIRTRYHSHVGFRLLHWVDVCKRVHVEGADVILACSTCLPGYWGHPSYTADELLARLVHARTGPALALNFWGRLHADKYCHNNVEILGLVLTCSDLFLIRPAAVISVGV